MARERRNTSPDVDSNPREPGPYERIVEEAEHAIYVTDPDGTITYVNPAFEAITGYTAEESIGRTPAILDSGNKAEEYFERLWETITEGDVWEEEITNRRKDGDLYVAHQTIAPITVDGEIEHFVAIQTDITEQKERQQALERSYDLLAETEQLAGVGGWELDLENEELRWSDGTRRIHEVSDDYEPSLAEAIEFYHQKDRARVEKAVEHCREYGAPYDIEVRLITAEGRTRWVRITGERSDRDASPVLLGAISDVTARKQREERLTVLNRVLRHNLRNDLNVITGSADQMQTELSGIEHSDDDDDETVQLSTETVEQIQTNAQRIQHTARELNDLAEKARDVEQGYEYDQITGPIDLHRLLEEVKTKYQTQFPEATIDIVGENVSALGNQDGLRKVVEELLENALKHTDHESPHATIHTEQVGSDQAVLTVADTGPGMPEMERETIEQGEGTSLMHGSGIGLWLVNWLVTRLGGSVTIEDNDPRGTVVRVELPATGSTESQNA